MLRFAVLANTFMILVLSKSIRTEFRQKERRIEALEAHVAAMMRGETHTPHH